MNKKVWNPNVLKWICIILLGLPGAILYVVNFYKLNHPKKHRNFIITIIIFVITFILNLTITIFPKYSIVIILLSFVIYVVTMAFFNLEQKSMFKKHIKNGGKKASAILAWIYALIMFSIEVLLVYCY